MKSRFLNIVLLVSLIISIIGVSTCKAFCYSFNVDETSCCKKDIAKDCCSVGQLESISKGLSSLKSNDAPHLLYLPIAYTRYIAFNAKIGAQNEYLSYNTPVLVKDIPIFNKVFRI